MATDAHPLLPPPFAGDAELPADRAALAAAPLRRPRPSHWGRDSGFAGKKALAAAGHLGIETIGGLLGHLPVESGEVATISRLRPEERQTVIAEVRSIRSRPVRRRGMRPLVEALVADGTGTMQVAFFNQPWLVERYPPGTRVLLSGTLKGPRRFSVAQHAPTSDPVAAAEPVDAGPSVARYPTTDGLTSIEIMARVGELREHFHDALDPLPARLRVDQHLPDRVAALHAAHLGDHEAGRRRLAFDELLMVQLEYLRRRRSHGRVRRAPRLDAPADLTDRWVSETLPFPLTGDQRRAIGANLATLAGRPSPSPSSEAGEPATRDGEPTARDAQPATRDAAATGAATATALATASDGAADPDAAGVEPLQRLLMGEVGSGKTVVALHAMLRAVECGHQAALMAPTETLADQHFRTIQALLPDALVPVGLLTGSTPAARRRPLLERLASGELPLIVGTHALLEDPVVFRSLAVAVVDEQHRFGVRQRSALDRKASGGGGAPPSPDGGFAAWAPHTLHMTATPIPRTMALLAYGDLDVVALRELPKGRRPIATHVCASDRERARAYQRIREEVAAGRQAFVVCPLVEDSENLEARSAVAEYERLRTGELHDLRLALLHGQMKPAEKQRAMEAFAAGEADVLVATTVIEVGIDVPNATVMLVENAERFGISQLHQLRGRVGRGEHQAICLLFGPKGAARLRALAAHADGFALSEVDLELRGEGELIGTRQSGLARFATARLPDDNDLLLRAREVAEQLAADDPELEDPLHRPLADAQESWRARFEADDDAIPA
ncbi:ATP-dependent DNA helicase RecG [Patulibacter medicamentivorans]|uniref:ATP-dependent DNA helicase RecG n=1 Tax=Patulibacter medicamentivorans TaxID=1097667 RepID=H0E9R7_9ACTN|nr:ATP-dependent DNA helicase RecG [Patulibacter medicamentivorans]EHN09566.1 ATP-dependent DNA helicase RecG [Patulibacter medicamentivorans]